MDTIDTLRHGQWHNEPAWHERTGDSATLVTDAHTDFWQTTFYGFERDSGHALGYWVDPDFTAQVRVQARFDTLYDQAGLYIRRDTTHWVKTGIEYNDDAPTMGSVLTAPTSDWATGDARCFWMRATCRAGVLRLQYSTDGIRWPLLRLAPWPGDSPCFVGVMACSPERAGLRVCFDQFSLGPALDKALHDLS